MNRDDEYIDEDPSEQDDTDYSDDGVEDAETMEDDASVEYEMLADLCEGIADEDDSAQENADGAVEVELDQQGAVPSTPTASNTPEVEIASAQEAIASRTQCGHKTSCIGGFIDLLLFNNASITNKQIADSWNGDGKRFLTKGMINGHIQHLMKDHGVKIEIEKLGKGVKKFSAIAAQ